jgi:hypothetical protein
MERARSRPKVAGDASARMRGRGIDIPLDVGGAPWLVGAPRWRAEGLALARESCTRASRPRCDKPRAATRRHANRADLLCGSELEDSQARLAAPTRSPRSEGQMQPDDSDEARRKLLARLLAAEAVRRGLLRDLRAMNAQVTALLAAYWRDEGVVPGAVVEREGRLWLVREVLLDRVLNRAILALDPSAAASSSAPSSTSAVARMTSRRARSAGRRPTHRFRTLAEGRSSSSSRPRNRQQLNAPNLCGGAHGGFGFFDPPPIRASLKLSSGTFARRAITIYRYTPMRARGDGGGETPLGECAKGAKPSPETAAPRRPKRPDETYITPCAPRDPAARAPPW